MVSSRCVLVGEDWPWKFREGLENDDSLMRMVRIFPGNSLGIKFLMFHKVPRGQNFAKAYKIKGLQVVLYILLLCYLINIYMRLFFTYYIVLLCSLLCIIFGVFGSLLQKTRNFGTIPKKPLQPYDFKAFYIVPGLRNFIRTLLNNTHYNTPQNNFKLH